MTFPDLYPEPYHDLTCAKIPERSRIQDPQDPRSGILMDLGSYSLILQWILHILDPANEVGRLILWILDPVQTT